MRTKKFMALFCLMAMVMSVCLGTVANAATTEAVAKGINYKIIENEELKKVYTISYAGFDKIKNFDVGATLVGDAADLAKVKSVEFSSELGIVTGYNSGTHFIGLNYSQVTPATPTDNILATVTINLTEDLSGELTLEPSSDSMFTTGDGDEYYLVDPEPGYEFVTNTLTLTKKESTVESVAATPVTSKDGNIFHGQNGNMSSVASVVDATVTKAVSQIKWKINVTPVGDNRYTGPTEKTVSFANVEANANLKVGLIVAFDENDIQNVEIIGIEY